MLKRLRADFQLSIISFMGLFGVLGIGPYAIYRLLEGNLLVGIVDSIIVVCCLISVLVAWYTGDTRKPGMVMAVIVSIGGVLVAIKLGLNGLFWIYVVILFNFFMVSPSMASVLIALMLSTLVGYSLLDREQVFASHYQMLSFIVTTLTASGFVFVFAYRMRSQRDQLQLQATLDPLTGASNRRSMDTELGKAISAKRRYGNVYGVLLMDLDHFKRVNDRFGHLAGDRVLIELVQLIASISRQEDRLFRMGGEEFLLLLPNADNDGLRASANKIQACLASGLRTHGEAITVSLGGAVLQHGESVESWLKRADDHLYQAKSEGRNRAVIDASDCHPAWLLAP